MQWHSQLSGPTAVCYWLLLVAQTPSWFPPNLLICGGVPQNQDRPPRIAFRFFCATERRSVSVRHTQPSPPYTLHVSQWNMIHWNNNMEAWYSVQAAGRSPEFMKVSYWHPSDTADMVNAPPFAITTNCFAVCGKHSCGMFSSAV